MSHTPAMPSQRDTNFNKSVGRNLLLGILALQNNFITRQQLIIAFDTWTADKSQAFGKILCDAGVLDNEVYMLLEALVRKHLAIHNEDPEQSLAAISSIGSVKDELHQLGDQDLDATLSHLSSATDADDLYATIESHITSGKTRFSILRPHARGGLGEVFIARDEELHREVALKEIQIRHADDPSSRARFIAEAQITGSLEHPGIVPVYGLGVYGDGRPYYAMRFIRGSSLKEAIDRFHEIRDTANRDSGQSSKKRDFRRLEFRKLLGRFIDVCNAIDYAHSRGVLHRDLKPGNIMLGKYGESLVVDWGLAKVIGRPDYSDQTELTVRPSSGSGSTGTAVGSAVGTPSYMSPEQALGRLDQIGPRTDVYGLGATLYSLLTGRAPFSNNKNAPGDDILQRVQRGDFLRPRAVEPKIPAALESVCLKAMSCDIHERYSSARELADELERWLADEKLRHHQEKWYEIASRWMRRHRTWVQAGTALMFLVLIISIAAALLINRAWRQESIAHGQAEESKREAIVRFQQARTAVNRWLTGAGESLKYYPSASTIRRRLLETAANDLAEMTSGRAKDLELELERGRTLLLLGSVQLMMLDGKSALQTYENAESLFTSLVNAHPQHPQSSRELANSQTNIGLVHMELGDIAAAERMFERSISHLDSLLLTNPKDDEAERINLMLDLNRALLNRAELLVDTGQWSESQKVLRRAIELSIVLNSSRWKRPEFPIARATARTLLGRVLYETGSYRDAAASLEEVVNELSGLIAKEPDNVPFLELQTSARVYLAGVWRALGRQSEEAAAYEQAISDYHRLLKTMPDVPSFYENIAITRVDLGHLFYRSGYAAEAVQQLQSARESLERLRTEYPDFPRYTEEWAASLDLLAQAVSDLGKNEEAKTLSERSVNAFRQLVEQVPGVVHYRERGAIALSHLAHLSHKLGQFAAAEAEFRRAIEELRALSNSNPENPAYVDELALAYENYSLVLSDTQQPEKSIEAFQLAVELRRDLCKSNVGAPEHIYHFVEMLVLSDRPQSSDPQQALQFADQLHKSTPDSCDYLTIRGAAYLRAGDTEKAIADLEQALKLRQGGNARDWLFLALARQKHGDHRDAQQSLQKANDWLDRHQPDNFKLKRLLSEVTASVASPPK
jgi:eukaryotic-like serine/threonine-protein kinase